MDIATIVYEHYLGSTGIKRKAWSYARRLTMKVMGDPTCSLSIHGRRLKVPLSHALPDFLKHCPFYDRLPERISEYVHRKQQRLNCIDVGANIGDTIAAFRKEEADVFLAIEPNPTFRDLLIANWGWNDKVTVVSDICSSSSSEGSFLIQEGNGTASIHQVDDGIQMTRRSLDEIVQRHPSAVNANVLKIDTDGHDFQVIAGAEQLISQNMPAVLFECDAFNNDNYVEDCLSTLSLFKRSGYRHFLLYSNFGNLMGWYSLADLLPFRQLLFFQLTSSFCYFDILVMRDDDLFPFCRDEVEYFIGKTSRVALRRSATMAVENSLCGSKCMTKLNVGCGARIVDGL